MRIEMPKTGLGWVYVMMTSSDYNRVKIGMTKNNPLERYTNGKTFDPNLSIVVAYYIPDGFGLTLEESEDQLHEFFSDERVYWIYDEDCEKRQPEWFSLDASESFLLVENALQSLGYYVTDDPAYQSKCKLAIRYWEHDLLVQKPCSLALDIINNGW